MPEEERQKIKDLLFILEKFNVSESAKRELKVFCDGLPRIYLVSSMAGIYHFERISGNIPGAYVTSYFHILYKVSPFAPKLNF